MYNRITASLQQIAAQRRVTHSSSNSAIVLHTFTNTISLPPPLLLNSGFRDAETAQHHHVHLDRPDTPSRGGQAGRRQLLTPLRQFLTARFQITVWLGAPSQRRSDSVRRPSRGSKAHCGDTSPSCFSDIPLHSGESLKKNKELKDCSFLPSSAIRWTLWTFCFFEQY